MSEEKHTRWLHITLCLIIADDVLLRNAIEDGEWIKFILGVMILGLAGLYVVLNLLEWQSNRLERQLEDLEKQ